jgi:hypothetical protein
MERRRNATSSLFEKNRNVAVLIFNDMDEYKVKELMNRLPMYKLRKSIEYLYFIKQF